MQVRTRSQEESLRFCNSGCILLIADGKGKQVERFFQLSSDMSSIRWSWSSYVFVSEVRDVQRSSRYASFGLMWDALDS